MNIAKRNTGSTIDITVYLFDGKKYCFTRRSFNVRRAKVLCKRCGVVFESAQRQKV